MPWYPDPYGTVPAPQTTIYMRYRYAVVQQVEPSIKQQLREHVGNYNMHGQRVGEFVTQQKSVPTQGVDTLLEALNSIPGVQAYKQLI